MTATLTKGGNLLLADEAPGIAEVRVGLGWTAATGGAAIELDATLSIAGTSGDRLLLSQQVPNPDEPVGARPAAHPPVGDAERLVVTLAAVPPEVTRLSFGAAIYDAAGRSQTFRSVHGAYIRVLDHARGLEIARYTLEVETGSETAMVFGELYRNPRGWKFRAVGQGYAVGLRGLAGGGLGGRGSDGSGEPHVARPVDVTDFLRRISPARSRRSVAEHLHPPAPVAPTPVRPTPPTSPSMSPPSMSPPSPPVAGRSSSPATEPAAPTRSTLDLSPLDLSPVDRSTSDRSTLDRSPSDPVATSSPAPVGTRNSSTAIVYGEFSSRRRQREEHVAVLDGTHPATTWTPEDRGSGGMTVTLRWQPLQTATGLPRPSDLHLGAFWEADRAEGILQTLGNTISAPGTAGPRQVLRLGRRDEREGQTIFVDLATLPIFRRFFVYAYGQHGSPEWALLRPELLVHAPSGESVTMRLGDAPVGARLCVAASFHVVDDDLVLRREDDYVDGLQADAALRYGWSLDWNPDGMTVRSSGRPG